MTLGEKVRLRRTVLRITQPELSNQTGLSQAYISQIENGDRTPATKKLVPLARALRCTVDYLVYEDRKKVS